MDITPPNAIYTKITRRVSTSHCCSLALPSLHRSSARPQCQKRGKRNLAAKAATSGHSNNGQDGSSMVDRDMLVLRKRMHQLRMEEMNYIPPQWMEWEKKWYPSYGSDVCDSLLWMQTMLLNTRPSIAMAVLALIFSSVVVSLLFLLMGLITFMSV